MGYAFCLLKSNQLLFCDDSASTAHLGHQILTDSSQLSSI